MCHLVYFEIYYDFVISTPSAVDRQFGQRRNEVQFGEFFLNIRQSGQKAVLVGQQKFAVVVDASPRRLMVEKHSNKIMGFGRKLY